MPNMIDAVADLEKHGTWSEKCEQFADYLGVPDSVPVRVLRRAMDDERFAYYLISLRNHPEELKVFFNDPKNARYELSDDIAVKGNGELIAKAAASLLKWGKTGFHRVENEVFERRMSACRACDRLVDPPPQAVYKLKLGQESDRRICGACGCVATRKAALPTESCPLHDTDNPALNRWGEPFQAS